MKLKCRKVGSGDWWESKYPDIEIDFYGDMAAQEFAEEELFRHHEGSASDFTAHIDVTDGEIIKRYKITADYSVDFYCDEE